MWLGKFLDLEEDINELRSRIKKGIFDNLKKNKLTPLELTIIERIFNKAMELLAFLYIVSAASITFLMLIGCPIFYLLPF